MRRSNSKLIKWYNVCRGTHVLDMTVLVVLVGVLNGAFLCSVTVRQLPCRQICVAYSPTLPEFRVYCRLWMTPTPQAYFQMYSLFLIEIADCSAGQRYPCQDFFGSLLHVLRYGLVNNAPDLTSVVVSTILIRC